MKKSMLLSFALLAVGVMGTSSAMALQPATRGVTVAGAQAGITSSVFVGPDGFGFGLGTCKHRLTWFAPAGPIGGSTTCDLNEYNVLGTFCSASVNVNIPVFSGKDCMGYLPAGTAPVKANLSLVESNGNPTLNGYGLFDAIGVPLGVQMQ